MAWRVARCIRPAADVVDGVTAYVVDYGDTSGLWLPVLDAPARRDDQRGLYDPYVEWCYGDWTWYAKDQQSVLYGAVVFLVPTQGALGWRESSIAPAFATSSEAGVMVHPIVVERAKAIALSESLAARYASQQSTEHFNVDRDIWFVHDDAEYWLGHQSTSQTGDWLEALGCDVSGFALVAHYTVE